MGLTRQAVQLIEGKAIRRLRQEHGDDQELAAWEEAVIDRVQTEWRVSDEYLHIDQRESQRRRRERARASGLCSACCTRVPMPGFKSCGICMERRRVCGLPDSDERRAKLAALRALSEVAPGA